MKKIFFIVSIIFLSVTSSFAVFFIDGQGDYMATGDFKPVTGYGLAVGFGITNDVNFLIRGSMAETTENVNLFNETRYSYSFVTGGLEYIPPIPVLEKYRIFWKNSVNIGASEFRYEQDNSMMGENKETGLYTSFKTGIQYNFTQIIAPYFDLGYHKSFYSDNEDLSIGGWQMALGIRIYIGGSRDYDNGY